MRMCVEQGLHTEHNSVGLRPPESQLRHRVFWLSYVMDRYSCITVNRPFSISDSDIEVPLPDDMDDIVSTQALLSNLMVPRDNQTINRPTQMSIALFTIRLRQISSNIHSEFASIVAANREAGPRSKGRFRSTGKIHLMLQRFTSELNEWRSSAPCFESPICLYERGEWADLMHARETFHLVRRAMDVAPKHEGKPSRTLLRLCHTSAIRVISVYSDLYERSLVTFTRSYFQMLFAAGLSLLYCGSTVSMDDTSLADECSHALSQCQMTLSDMVLELPAAGQYVAIFEALNRHISSLLRPALSRADLSQHQGPTVSRPADVTSNALGYATSNAFRYCDSPAGYDAGQHHDRVAGEFGGSGDPMDTSTVAPRDWENTESADFVVDPDYSFDHNTWDWGMLNDYSMWNVGQFALGDAIFF